MRCPAIGALLGVLAVSCTVDPPTDSRPPSSRFESGFEQASTLAELFPSDLSGWTNVQCVQPNGVHSSSPSGMSVASGSNSVSLDTYRFLSGRNSLRCEAPFSGSAVSKASIVKQGMDFRPGDRVNVQFRAYLEDNGSAENVFLLDLESTEIEGYPGRRLALSGSQELILESKNTEGTYGSGPNFKQPALSRTPMPKGRWVSIELEIALSRDSGGSAKIRQDGVVVLDAEGRTFPVEPEVTRFDWIELGLTANSSIASQRLWIDDVAIVVVRP